jgi:hypothetical protein
MENKTRIYFDDFVNAVHNCDRRSQFCERRSQFSIVNVGANPRFGRSLQTLATPDSRR